MFKLQISVPGGSLEITGDKQKDIIKQAAFFQSLPQICPVDGSPAVFHFKQPDDFEYFGLVSTGEGRRYEYKCGQHRDGHTLFAKDQWVFWDGQREIVVWEAGRFVNGHGPKVAQPEQRPQLHTETQAQPRPEPQQQAVVQHRQASPEQPPPAANGVQSDKHNPFEDPLAGVEGEKILDYGQIADSLVGNTAQFAVWANRLHSNPEGGPASKGQYEELVTAINWATGGASAVVLSVLCRRYVTAENPCGSKLAAALLDYIPAQVARRDEKGRVVRVDGLIAYVENPKYKPEYVPCLREIAEVVKVWRTQVR